MEKQSSFSPMRIAVVGATGAVGQEILRVLEKRSFPLTSLRCFASEKSQGKQLSFGQQKISVEILSERCFEEIDIAIFSAGSKISKIYAPLAVESGAIVIDNSSAYRMNPRVPLIIPEINSHRIHDHSGIIASPNCSTTIMLMALFPLHQAFHIQRVVAATYQAASGAGAAAMEELKEGTRAFLDQVPHTPQALPFPYAFNLFTHNSALSENGYVEEELKMLRETRKILENNAIWVHATCVRVPVLRAHAEALNVTFSYPISIEKATKALQAMPGLILWENRGQNRFPMPSDASGQDAVFCGRLREDPSFPNTLDLWVVGDQLLKGAALNAVQIAEQLINSPYAKNSRFGSSIFCTT